MPGTRTAAVACPALSLRTCATTRRASGYHSSSACTSLSRDSVAPAGRLRDGDRGQRDDGQGGGAYVDGHHPMERQLGLVFGLALLCKCAEVWVFGSRISPGMEAEIKRARWKNIRLRHFTEECKEIE